VRIIGEYDMGADKNIFANGYHLQEAITVYPAVVADFIVELKHGIRAYADIPADDIVFPNRDTLSGLKVVSNCGASVDCTEGANVASCPNCQHQLTRFSPARRFAKDRRGFY
jgi:hypothetical protein